MQEFEKLGAFYLGRTIDSATKTPAQAPLLYESKDLVTHAVCVGMTGSGKTGLCIGLLEEAAIDGVPAIAVDPKGDIANLLLAFPELRAEDFAPWVSEDEARQKGLGIEEFAAQQAQLWKDGLAKFGQQPERIGRFKDAVDFSIYTPGSESGLPLSILNSFAVPEAQVIADDELLRDQINAAVTSLLGLAGIDADPIQSREHVLLSKIFETNWRSGKNLDLPNIISQIQRPPFEKVGVLDLESFYAAKDRFSLATVLNNLLASPGFTAWLKGEPLDVSKLLYTAEGKPRISVISIAHLSDRERMFFVSLLLNQLLSWVRTQRGTSSLRALFYMDEIFGYFPPVANPPSKKPLLTLLKQARAYGLGLVLATQNPVDLDYKGLANIGTWFIGRLQTERDKMRVLEGLEGAAGEAHSEFDRTHMDRLLAGLGSRIFLLNNVHEDGPQLFQTRWTLSYLRGPLTREQIRQLMKNRREAPKGLVADTRPAMAASPAEPATAAGQEVPVLPPEIQALYFPNQMAGNMIYQPVLVGAAKLHYLDEKRQIDEVRSIIASVPFRDGAVSVDWTDAGIEDIGVDEFERSPEAGIPFMPVPSPATKPKNYAAWSKAFVTWLFQTQQITLLKSPNLNELSKPGESERDFRVRLQQTAREERDRATEKLKQAYAPKLAALAERKRRAELAAERQKSQQSQALFDTAVSIGSGLLGAFLGRKTLSVSNLNRASTVARKANRSWQEHQDVGEAAENVEQVSQQIAELQQRFDDELAALAVKLDPATEALEEEKVRVKKANIGVQFVTLGWKPIAPA